MRQQRHRVRLVAPMQRLLVQRQHVGLPARRDRRDQGLHVGQRDAGRELAVPQRHVVGGMLAAHEARDA